MRKRVICFAVIVSILSSSAIGRCAYIIFSENYPVSKGYNSYSLSLETLYPTVYYSDNKKLSNNTMKYAAVLKPNEKTISDLYNLFPANQIHSLTNELGKGYPIIKEVDFSKKDAARNVQILTLTGTDYPSKQLISASSGGLLSYTEPFKEKRIRFHIDAMGRLLKGDEGEIYEEELSNLSGIKTTLSKKVEDVVLEASSELESGCIIVMEVKTSSILAVINKPDSTYINKAFEMSSVGSVFKIIVAVCALENNIEYYYTCSGKTTVGDTEFSCQNVNAHGFQNMNDALAHSCNCYFVNLALKLGSEKLLETAHKLGFDDEIKLYDGWSVKSSQLPDKNDLKSSGELALFGFGQGMLLSTPLQICFSLCTIANGGMKNPIRFITEEKLSDSKKNYLKYNEGKEAISPESSIAIIKMLRNVVENGTGKNAEDSLRKAAGKTATAQTGRYLLNKEILTTWFAGVYPYDNPKYAIVVMKENGKSGSEDCAPIYRQIVEKLNYL